MDDPMLAIASIQCVTMLAFLFFFTRASAREKEVDRTLQAAIGTIAVHAEDLLKETLGGRLALEEIAMRTENLLKAEVANNSLLKGLIRFEEKKRKKWIQTFGQEQGADPGDEENPFKPGVSKAEPRDSYEEWLDEMQLPPEEPEPGKRADGTPFMPMPDRVIKKEAKALATQQRAIIGG